MGPAPTRTDAVLAATASTPAVDTDHAVTGTDAQLAADVPVTAALPGAESETDPAPAPESSIDITDAAAPAAVAPTLTGHNEGTGLTGPASFLVMLIPALVGCVIGFLLTGATSIPALAGYGLILGAIVVGLRVSPRLRWFPVCLPPVVMFAVVATAGQVTLIGSRPTIAREATMIMANLATTAPAQMVSVAIIAVLVFVRRRRAAR